jgi:H+/Cl- antiporter ClcA
MTTDRSAERLGLRPAEGDERLQLLLVFLLALCVLAGWLLIRELAPAARHGRTPTTIEAALPGN